MYVIAVIIISSSYVSKKEWLHPLEGDILDQTGRGG